MRNATHGDSLAGTRINQNEYKSDNTVVGFRPLAMLRPQQDATAVNTPDVSRKVLGAFPFLLLLFLPLFLFLGIGH